MKKLILTALALAAVGTAAPAVAQQRFLQSYELAGHCRERYDDGPSHEAQLSKCFGPGGSRLPGVMYYNTAEGIVGEIRYARMSNNQGQRSGGFPQPGNYGNYQSGPRCHDSWGNPQPCQQGAYNSGYGQNYGSPRGNNRNYNGGGSLARDMITGGITGAVVGDGNDWEDAAKGAALNGLLGAILR